MSLAYPPNIVANEYVDGRGISMGSRRVANVTASQGTLNCPLQQGTPPQPSARLCAVTELTVRAGGKTSKSFLKADHANIPSADPSRVNFAPKREELEIHWKVENPDVATSAKLEIFRRKQSLPIASVEFGPDDLAIGQTTYGGATDGMLLFPSGYLNVEHGPFKIKITLEGPTKQGFEQAFTYFDVVIHSIELSWGPYSELPQDRTDIDPAQLEKIVGNTGTGTKGWEEENLDRIVAANPTPGAGQQHQVILPSDIFAKKLGTDMEVAEYVQRSDFDLYKQLWGNGARLPLHAKVYVKKADGSKTLHAPEALAGCKLLWEWHVPRPDRWKTGLKMTTKTEDYLKDLYSQSASLQPAQSSNCPHNLGGKLGDNSAPIFRHYDGTGPFPYKAEACKSRTWASFSYFPTAGRSAERCTTGVVFHPSRIAGDFYEVSCALYFDRAQDSPNAVDVAPVAKAEAGSFEVFRKTTLNYLVRGTTADLGCDPASIEARIKDTYLKECKTVMAVNRIPINNADYILALKAAATAVEKRPNCYTQFPMMALYTRHLVDFNPPANSPGIVVKQRTTFLADMETIVRNGRVRKLAAGGLLAGEEIEGQTSGVKGIPLTISPTTATNPVMVLVEVPGEFQAGESVKGFCSGVTAPATVTPLKNCWDHSFTEVVSAESQYDHAVKLSFGANNVTVVFPKTGVRRRTSTAITDRARIDIEAWLRNIGATHNETSPLPITITHKGKNSPNHTERIANLKTVVEDMLTSGIGFLDRKAWWEKFKTTWTPGYDEATYRQMFQKNFSVSWMIQGTVEEYVKLRHATDIGIFLMHLPGRNNSRLLPDLSTRFQDLRVAGAFYGEAFYTERNKTATYVATLPANTPNLFPEKVKSIDSIFVHEAGHAIFLPHAPRVDPRATAPAQDKEGCHVKGDNCLMNYDVDSEHFCAICMLRLRGWDWTPLDNALGPQEYQVLLELDDIDSIFSAPASSRDGLKERLQVLGLLNRPLNHPEADEAFDFCWNHFKLLFPDLEGASFTYTRLRFTQIVKEFLLENGQLPAVGQFGKIRAPGGYYTGFSQNYLEAAIPPAQQSTPAAAPFESMMLGADRGKLEDNFYAANPALGKIPLKVTVRRRDKGSTIPWGNCPLAPGARVYFELLPPDLISGAPPGTTPFITVAGAKCYHPGVKPPDLAGTPGGYLQTKAGGFKPTAGPDANNAHFELGGKRGQSVFCKPQSEGFETIPFDPTFKFASVVTADDNGVARVVFSPSRVGGDSYRLRTFVGPVTQPKTTSELALGGDDVVETGTMVRWRTIRVCHDIIMTPAANAGEAPADSCKKADSTLMPNVANYFGTLMDLDLSGVITAEFAKAYCELLIEPEAEAPVSITLFEDDIKATALDLANRYPKFNSSAAAGLSIQRTPMTVVATSNNTVFSVTLPVIPEKGALTVRPANGGLSDALFTDKDGTPTVTPRGTPTLTNVAVDYTNRVVTATFNAPQPGGAYDVCYHPAKYVDLDKILFFPNTSPFLINLQLPRVYNNGLGAGYRPADIPGGDEAARPDPFFSFIDARTLGLCKALLLDAIVRGVNRNGGYYPGLLFFRSRRLDNYTAIWPTGVQEGKGVGNGIFLFDPMPPDRAKFNWLTLHEMSHGLFLMHAPSAAGSRPAEHDSGDVCAMSYDANDGDHCGQCVAVLKGMKTRNAPFP